MDKGKGQYGVYERASRDAERLFLNTAKEVIDLDEIREEPRRNWRKKKRLLFESST
jgi:hypothetical protein